MFNNADETQSHLLKINNELKDYVLKNKGNTIRDKIDKLIKDSGIRSRESLVKEALDIFKDVFGNIYSNTRVIHNNRTEDYNITTGSFGIGLRYNVQSFSPRSVRELEILHENKDVIIKYLNESKKEEKAKEFINFFNVIGKYLLGNSEKRKFTKDILLDNPIKLILPKKCKVDMLTIEIYGEDKNHMTTYVNPDYSKKNDDNDDYDDNYNEELDNFDDYDPKVLYHDNYNNIFINYYLSQDETILDKIKILVDKEAKIQKEVYDNIILHFKKYLILKKI